MSRITSHNGDWGNYRSDDGAHGPKMRFLNFHTPTLLPCEAVKPRKRTPKWRRKGSTTREEARKQRALEVPPQPQRREGGWAKNTSLDAEKYKPSPHPRRGGDEKCWKDGSCSIVAIATPPASKGGEARRRCIWRKEWSRSTVAPSTCL